MNFKGRARKREYWGFNLFNAILSLIGLLFIFTGIGAILSLIIFAITLLPFIAVTVRRLHDMNKSGWFALAYLIAFIPLVGEIVALVIWVVVGLLDGTKGDNQYGEDPLVTQKQ